MGKDVPGKEKTKTISHFFKVTGDVKSPSVDRNAAMSDNVSKPDISATVTNSSTCDVSNSTSISNVHESTSRIMTNLMATSTTTCTVTTCTTTPSTTSSMSTKSSASDLGSSTPNQPKLLNYPATRWVSQFLVAL
jgi:hypothetical protein